MIKGIVTFFKEVIAVAFGLAGFAFGGFDSLIFALIVVMVLDYLTGMALSVKLKKISSTVGFAGICRKGLSFVIIAAGNIIDKYVFGSGTAVRTAFITFYISNECISIVENLGGLDVPLPGKVKEVLEKLKDDKTDSDK